MIKATGHIILSFLLLLSTSGLVVSKHFCGGKLISTSFYVEADSCCDSGDCCKNETEVFKLDEDIQVSTMLELPQLAQMDLLAIPLVIFNLKVEEDQIIEEFTIAESPPPSPKIQISLAKRQTYLL